MGRPTRDQHGTRRAQFETGHSRVAAANLQPGHGRPFTSWRWLRDLLVCLTPVASAATRHAAE